MTTKVAPWLQGLSDGGWAPPQNVQPTQNITSATDGGYSLRSSRSRIPRRSLSGLPSSLSRHTSASQASTQRKRNPLAPLSNNDANTLQRHNSTTKPAATRSVSEASDGSLPVCGTVQLRSKSASPPKKQETLEWKRRLVHGEVGYGDQTDLFGPSGLENIFSRSKGTENEVPKPTSKMGWLQKSDVPMPSSPPPWPSSFTGQLQPAKEPNSDVLDSVVEERQTEESMEEHRTEDSFNSNPFDLETSEDSLGERQQVSRSVSQYRSSPDKAFIEPTEDEAAVNRTVSGQTELEQEDFSPVFVSKHHTITGQVDYAAVDSHMIKQFQNMKVDLRHPSQQNSQETSDGSGRRYGEVGEQSTFTDGPESQSLPGAPDLSFSENLPTGSPFPNLGKNVELKRGGYSQFGSFRRRPLSPSQSAAEDSNDAGASGLLSPILSEQLCLPQAPTPPRTPGVPSQIEEPKSRSSRSPLKLFGTHDTFTNNRLLRRLSQLNPDGTLRQPADVVASQTAGKERICSNGSFGSGEFDNHDFDAEITITSASDSDKSGSDGSPGSEVLVPGSKTPLAFRFEPSPQLTDTHKVNRKLSKHSRSTSKASTLEKHSKPTRQLQATIEDASESNLEQQPEPTRSYGPGKRPPNSPFKIPTPKRRRTLHASELEDGIVKVNDSYHSQLQEAVSSRKRKDARRGETQNTADPDVLASRKILRPRNPTPNQRRQQIEVELREAAEEFAEMEPEKLEAVMEQIESSMASDAPQSLEQQARNVASEVAAFTLRVRRPSGELDGERKRSVTTQDFLNEAMMVMNSIRAKARPQSNLGSVEESDAERSRADDTKEPNAGESLLRVSRPPSREGSGWRQRAPVQIGARVMSHLRKFQEGNDRDETDFIANSIASLQVEDEEPVNNHVVVVDKDANIRITGPPSGNGKQPAESDSRPNSQRSQGSTLDTQKSNGTSTGRTIGTSSTRKSENVGTLAPDAVAHLIGDQVGGMTFDKDQQRWVRVSKSPAKSTGSFLELPSNVTSDDDPFREISDLPVDEQNELRRISSPGKLVESLAAITGKTSVRDQAVEKKEEERVSESRTTSQETVVPRPVTRDSSNVQPNHSSSVPSRYTAFASSQQEKVETRATSWSDEELAKMSALGKARNLPPTYAATRAEIARESVVGRASNVIHQNQTNLLSTSKQPPILEDVANEHSREVSENDIDETQDHLTALREDTALEAAEVDIEDIMSPKLRQTPSKPSFPPSSTHKTATRQLSLRRKTLTNQFTAEAHEQSELSFIAPLPGDRMMSLSLSVSRPLSKRQQPHQVTELQSSPSKGNSSFILSDLPDFTVHEEDAERPSERALATRLAQHTAAEINDRYAVAVKELVKILTDVHEDEPYWEDLKQLDLHSRSLASLHGLEDFCSRVQDMDVSNNALTHLHGSPMTIRRLNARSNQLSSLTAWNHLVNLQYLDVSNNHLESLDGLSGLIHLRELRADDNEIARLSGVFELDGLLKLRVRRNKLRHVDFEGAQLKYLTALDLAENEIMSIMHLDALVSLSDMRLDGNNLHQSLPAQTMPLLSSLSLRDCNVEELDVTPFPKLNHLDVDGNHLARIDGLSKLKNLHVLSMRRQTLREGTTISVFDEPLEAHTVRLSGTTMPSVILSTRFLSIRHLELASVGLQDLPDDFGLRMPNLRTLNLNFNNLKDIRPLLNIHKLEHLSACGNLLYRLRKSVATFGKMNGLQTLDIRDNPLTQGFYPNIAATMSRHTGLVRRVRGQSGEGEDEREDLGRYEYPPADVGQDKQHRSLLDEDTKLRRRVYEMLLANGCRALEELDGLRLDRASAAAKDSVWERLVQLGIITRSQNSSGIALWD